MFGSKSSSSVSRRRFSVLMLEEREYYFEDHPGFMCIPPTPNSTNSTNANTSIPTSPTAATATNANTARDVAQYIPMCERVRIKGRLHIASKSVIFESDDSSLPIHKFAFRDMLAIRPAASRTDPSMAEYFVVHTKQITQIYPRQPYHFVKVDLNSPQSEYAFTVTFSSLAKFFPTITQLLVISKMDRPRRADALAEFIAQREQAISFDSSSLLDYREKFVLPNGKSILASSIAPLSVVPGCMQITDQRIYFQPFHQVALSIT